MTAPVRSRTIERLIRVRLRRLERDLGEQLARIRIDAGASRSRVGSTAGVDRTFLGRIEAGNAHPSLETLVACGTALGAEVSVRIYAGTGPRLTDRHQARMVECILRELHPIWRPHLEVAVSRPVRGVIDGVFERHDSGLFVVSDFQSSLPRLEQQLRWMAEKSGALGSSDLVDDRPMPVVSRLLVLRSTVATRSIARAFESTLRAAYPARTREAVESLRTGSPWPGAAIVWVRIDGDTTVLLDGPPRGVALGRG